MAFAADAFEVLTAVERMNKGLPPVEGGQLDQAAALMDAADLVDQQMSRWRAASEEAAARSMLKAIGLK